ncbi:MAG: hypothetical protein FJX66_07665 [Alphaproteobacteria bacterium]|nr:hypothetical protein [Alphaproteobacteria bacterium]
MAGKILPPQLITNARMLILCYEPADPRAVAALLPPPLRPARNKAIFLNQYVVDKPEQTSGFGSYSLTYIGPELAGYNADKMTQGRFWTHYLNSNPLMRNYVKERGVPAKPGETTLELKRGRLVATTYVNNKPIIRSTVAVGATMTIARGQLRYINKVGRSFYDGRYPYVMPMAERLEVISLEFLDPNHSIYALRPANPVKLTAPGLYTPAGTFCYPGGYEPMPKISG